MSVDFSAIWATLSAHFSLGDYSVHGPDHWRRVEANGLALTEQTGADREVVRLFAVFHDAERRNDGADPEHGNRAAELARQLHGDLFGIADARLELLCQACAGHNGGGVSDDATIGTCWDADRLDLPRVGIWPHPRYMSTAEGRRRARHGVWSRA